MPVSSRDVAYMRWEPLRDDTDESSHVEFHRFQEESRPSGLSKISIYFANILKKRHQTTSGISTIHKSGSQSNRATIKSTHKWSVAIRVLTLLIVFGLGWIVGFLVRWGVHKYYIDPMGHCVAPESYSFDAELAKLILNKIDDQSIRNHLSNFTAFPHHQVGSSESASYVDFIVKKWTSFPLDQVEVDLIQSEVPVATNTPSELRVYNDKQEQIFTLNIPELNALYSANGSAEGPLVYGHYGRYSELKVLKDKYGLKFNGSIVVIKTYSPLYDPGSAVRNAQMLGAKAVILFPDPIQYILTKTVGVLPRNVSLTHSVKFTPGDPKSRLMNPSGQETGNDGILTPSIPVLSISYENATPLLKNYVNAKDISQDFWFSLPLNTTSELNFLASVSVNTAFKKVQLRNVVGVIRGRYEPTRYVIIGCRHDTLHEGANKPGVGHSVLMEIARVFGLMSEMKWKPGRSIIFASWDGEEFGSLGSTDWLSRHSRELDSRAVAYINLDEMMRGEERLHVVGSPLLENILQEAAKLSSCSKPFYANNSNCVFYDELDNIGSQTNLPLVENRAKFTGFPSAGGISEFQSIFGVSSLKVMLQNYHAYHGDAYPFVGSSMDNSANLFKHLDISLITSTAKFVMAIILQLVMPALINVRTTDYSDAIDTVIDSFLVTNEDKLKLKNIDYSSLRNASIKFQDASLKFHSSYDLSPALALLGYHEFNDQLMELERAFLMPSHLIPMFLRNNSIFDPDSLVDVLAGTYKHVIYGPDLTNFAQMQYLPRLQGSVFFANMDDSPAAWKVVEREIFFVVNALESAACVLENHLVMSHN